MITITQKNGIAVGAITKTDRLNAANAHFAPSLRVAARSALRYWFAGWAVGVSAIAHFAPEDPCPPC